MCPLDRDLKDNDKDKEHGKRGQGWKQGQGHDHYLDLTLQIKRCCSRCFHFLDRGKLLCRPRCKALLCSQPATKTNNFQPNSQLASAHKYKYKCKNKKSTQPTKIFNPIDDKYSHILSVFQMFLKTV